MDNGSTEWVNGLLEVTLAMNTQKHSTIGCAPAELLFRERTSYLDWLNNEKRKDITVGVAQENTAIAGQMSRELSLIVKERKRRMI